jgi:cytochrome c
MRTIIPGAALAALFVGGCSAGAADRLNTRMEPSPSSVAQPAAVEARLALGREVFDRACAACHTVEPPPRLAPPMSHVAAHYRQAFADPEAGVAHIAGFVQSPTRETTRLPARATERWGLMPPVVLPEAEREAVALYVWHLAETAAPRGGPRRRAGR